MKKLAIIFDSFSGKSKKEVESIENHFYIPLKTIIDDVEYLDGIDLSAKELITKCEEGDNVKTSQPSPAEIEEIYSRLSKEYENVIYLPSPKTISGTANTAEIVAKDFNNVHVVTGFGVGDAYYELAKYLLQEIEQGKDIQQLLKFSKEYLTDIPALVIPKTIDAFVKGGRMGKSLSAIFSKMHIIPIVSMQDEDKLKKKQIKRSGRSAANYAIEKTIEVVGDKKDDYIFQITHTVDTSVSDYAVKKLKELGVDVHVEMTSGLVSAHTGDGAFSISAHRKLIK